jgi:TolB-like protein/Tfp pilus assembly protein PilF
MRAPRMRTLRNFELDLHRYELKVDGKSLHLERQPMDLLILLARNEGRLVTREEIVSALWGEGIFVDSERSINSMIHKLRTALRDDAKRPRVIETVIGKGYRLLAEVNIAGASAIHSIAVLPLRNLSGDPGQNYFAAGLTDELTTNLARIKSLRVVSATSSTRYGSTSTPLPQIARDLNVDAVIEGSVARFGSSVRIIVQLVDARTDTHLWADTYNRELGEILEIQDSVALEVAAQVRANLSPEERESLVAPKAVIPQAYDAYLRGRIELGGQTPETLQRGLEQFQQAIALDPGYPQAYAALADSYSLLADYTALLPNTAFPRAKSAALKALERDQSLGEAHAALAYVKHHFEWDWLGAETEYKVAIQLDPSRATTHLRYAELLSNLERHDEAVAEVNLAHRLAPLSRLVESKIGWFLYQARRCKKGIPYLQQIVASDPTQYYARIFLGLCYEQQLMYPEALAEFERTASDFEGRESAAQAHTYACTGRRDDARRILKALEQPGPDGAQSWFWIASVYAALGETDEAFCWLNRAFENRDYFLTFLKTEPRMDPLRSDPRFANVMEKLAWP